MYHIPYFKAAQDQEVIDFMHQHPFIVLCGIDKNNFPVATHIPILLQQRNDQLFLTGHVMRKQQHTVAFEANSNVLAIFQAANSYISASWYETKNIASTWNYLAVHAKGILRWISEEALYEQLVQLTNHFEKNENSSASVKNMHSDYVANSLKAIKGFEIEVTEVEHVFKFSQNRDEKSFDNIINSLQKGNSNEQAIAEEMQKRKDQIFNK